MAVATAVPTAVHRWWDTKRVHVIGTLAIGASPLTYATGGITLNFNVQGFGAVSQSRVPDYVLITSAAGFNYVYVNGTGPSDGLLKVFIASAAGTNQPLTEYTAVAVSAGLSGDVPIFHSIFHLR